MKNKLIFTTTFLLVAFATQLFAQDWPQFLGPERNSTSPQKGVPNELVIVKDAPHFGVMFDSDEVRTKVMNFLKKQLN